MNINKVIKQLSTEYPNKNIIKNSENNPTEILCEVEPTSDHPEYSLAVAVLDKSVPHVHHKTKETYTVIKGKLVLHVDGIKHELSEGEEMNIETGQVHWAEGNETWVECYSEPGWTFEDHILDENA